jgi:hypothetical protein
MSGLPQDGQARGTRWVKPQWWQRSVRSILWNTWCALQCGQSLFQPQSGSAARGEAAAVEQHQALLAALHALGDGRQQRRANIAPRAAGPCPSGAGARAAPMRLGISRRW